MILSFFALFMMLQSVSDAACYQPGGREWRPGPWPGKREERIMRLSSRGSRDEVNEMRRALARGRRPNGSWQLASVRPELGHTNLVCSCCRHKSLSGLEILVKFHGQSLIKNKNRYRMWIQNTKYKEILLRHQMIKTCVERCIFPQ